MKFNSLDECLNSNSTHLYSSMRTNLSIPPKKKIRTEEKLIPMVFALLKKSLGADKRMTINALLDSGASHSIIDKKCVSKLRLKNCTQLRGILQQDNSTPNQNVA